MKVCETKFLDPFIFSTITYFTCLVIMVCQLFVGVERDVFCVKKMTTLKFAHVSKIAVWRMWDSTLYSAGKAISITSSWWLM
jgi:hypothetical protein